MTRGALARAWSQDFSAIVERAMVSWSALLRGLLRSWRLLGADAQCTWLSTELCLIKQRRVAVVGIFCCGTPRGTWVELDVTA